MLTKINPLILVVFSLWILWGFGFETVGQRLLTEVQGTVTESTDDPARGAPRYVTRYILEDKNGNRGNYTAGPTDASLPRGLPIGTVLDKRKWDLSYTRDGKRITDFPVVFYAVTISAALALGVWGLILWHSNRRSPRSGAE